MTILITAVLALSGPPPERPFRCVQIDAAPTSAPAWPARADFYAEIVEDADAVP